jgi:hypothetical protein
MSGPRAQFEFNSFGVPPEFENPIPELLRANERRVATRQPLEPNIKLCVSYEKT